MGNDELASMVAHGIIAESSLQQQRSQIRLMEDADPRRVLVSSKPSLGTSPKIVSRLGRECSEIISDEADEMPGICVEERSEDGSIKKSSLGINLESPKQFQIVFDYKDRLIFKKEALIMIRKSLETAEKLGCFREQCIIVDENGKEIPWKVFGI